MFQRLTHRLSTPRLLAATLLLNATACTGDLDDPFGVKQRLAQERRVECQQVHTITEAYSDEATAVRVQHILSNGETPSSENLMKTEAELSRKTIEALETLSLEDQDIKHMSLELASSLRKKADEDSEYYGVILYALEVYCEGDSLIPLADSATE
ncbi:MAG: hypothetical protein AAFY17_13990 [Cyanobacteria bacterium J06642_11]